MVIQAQVTQNGKAKSCKLFQDKKSLKQGLRILNPKGSSFLRIRMKNPRILDPRTTIPRTRNPRTMNPRISNPLKAISKPDLQSRIKDPQSQDQGSLILLVNHIITGFPLYCFIGPAPNRASPK